MASSSLVVQRALVLVQSEVEEFRLKKRYRFQNILECTGAVELVGFFQNYNKNQFMENERKAAARIAGFRNILQFPMFIPRIELTSVGPLTRRKLKPPLFLPFSPHRNQTKTSHFDKVWALPANSAGNSPWRHR